MRSCREAWTARRHLRSVLLGDESRHLSGFQLSLKSSLRVVTIACCSAFLLVGRGLASDERSTLVIGTPGIPANANDHWVGVTSELAPTHDRWIIRQEKSYASWLTNSSSSAEHSHIPNTHVITLRTNVTPDQIHNIAEKVLAANSNGAVNATVLVDMDLNAVGIGWKTETTWEAKVVEGLGKYFRDQHPDGAAVWIAHSAGCEAMPMVDNHPTGYSVPLFQREIAMSARSLPDSDHVYANETLFVQSLGDYRYSSGGYLNKAAVTSWVTEADARELVAIGHSVLLLNTGYLDISYGDMSSVAAMVEEAGTLTREKWITLAGVAAGTTVGAFADQQEHDLAIPGIAATLFTPEHPNGVALPDANVASHIQTAEAIHATEDAPR